MKLRLAVCSTCFVLFVWFATVPVNAAGPPLAGVIVHHLRVIPLFADNADELIPQMTNDNIGWPSTTRREDRDFFAGACAIRVGQLGTPYQRFTKQLRGWAFPIKEKPGLGEYRYLRFAWKKVGGQTIMVQLHGNEARSWGQRYVVGVPNVDWTSTTIGAKIPTEWRVETRDLFKDFGEFTIHGLALSPLDGDYGLFDHFYLARSVADLDRHDAMVFGRGTRRHFSDAERLQLWHDLASLTATAAAQSISQMARDDEIVGFLRERLRPPAITNADRVIQKLVNDLDSERFVVRERASRELAKHGTAALPLLRQALPKTTSPEAQRRMMLLMQAQASATDTLTIEQLRTVRALRVLEKMNTTAARRLLEELAAATLEAELSTDARQALARAQARTSAVRPR